MKKSLLTIFMLIALVTNAQNIFQDNFGSYNTGVQLSGQGTWSNNTSNGGLGACSGAICTNAYVLSQNINYTGYGSSTKAHQLLSDTDNCGTLFSPIVIASGDVYVSFVLNVSNTVASPSDFLRVLAGNSFTTVFRCYTKAVGGNTFTFGIEKGSSTPTYSATAFNYNQDHLVVIKYSKFAGSNDDVVNVYIDPVYLNGEPASPTVSTFSGTDATASIDRLSFRQGASTTPSGYASLVSVARTWQDLTFTLANTQFDKNNFTISSTDVKSGLLSIKSNINIDKSALKIYDIQGRTIESKSISLHDGINDVSIHPISTTGVYVVEITSESNQRFTQKIIVN